MTGGTLRGVGSVFVVVLVSVFVCAGSPHHQDLGDQILYRLELCPGSEYNV